MGKGKKRDIIPVGYSLAQVQIFSRFNITCSVAALLGTCLGSWICAGALPSLEDEEADPKARAAQLATRNQSTNPLSA